MGGGCVCLFGLAWLRPVQRMSGLERARDTVAVETPASVATSLMRARGKVFIAADQTGLDRLN